MPSLKAIRKRVSTVRSTQQITKAMKMVAAAKLRRSQEAAESARPYADKLGELLASLSSRVPEGAHPFLGEAGTGPAHAVLVTSDRGLCGGYNSNLIRVCQSFLASDAGREATLTACGRRGRDFFRRRIAGRIVVEHVNQGLNLDLARTVAADVSHRFLTGETGAVYLIYAKFRSAISQTPVVVRLLPIVRAEEVESAPVGSGELVTDYVYEPDPVTLLESLLARYVQTRVFQAMLEGTASEHGARMTAMDNASRNAAEMIDRLTLMMNRARQATITKELMEIVGGAEALNG